MRELPSLQQTWSTSEIKEHTTAGTTTFIHHRNPSVMGGHKQIHGYSAEYPFFGKKNSYI
jgi:hypothetical protein